MTTIKNCGTDVTQKFSSECFNEVKQNIDSLKLLPGTKHLLRTARQPSNVPRQSLQELENALKELRVKPHDLTSSGPKISEAAAPYRAPLTQSAAKPLSDSGLGHVPMADAFRKLPRLDNPVPLLHTKLLDKTILESAHKINVHVPTQYEIDLFEALKSELNNMLNGGG